MLFFNNRKQAVVIRLPETCLLKVHELFFSCRERNLLKNKDFSFNCVPITINLIKLRSKFNVFFMLFLP